MSARCRSRRQRPDSPQAVACHHHVRRFPNRVPREAAVQPAAREARPVVDPSELAEYRVGGPVLRLPLDRHGIVGSLPLHVSEREDEAERGVPSEEVSHRPDAVFVEDVVRAEELDEPAAGQGHCAIPVARVAEVARI
jgi:hypothetical protein